jgi:luciferase family oxidoreductase group 1
MSEQKQWKLSVHDLSPVGPKMTAGDALRNSIDLARRVEQLGYTRYWFAEHHNIRTLACSQPAIMIAQAAAVTSTIRIGSGGVMLPNHSSLIVAEEFRTLEALYPDRIDLGIGRAPGTDGRTAIALRRSRHALGADDFPDQLEELLGYFHNDLPRDHQFRGIEAIPAQAGNPELWMLGSSEGGTEIAAAVGVGFAFASHLNQEGAVPLLQAYRRFFQPSRYLQEPKSIFSCSVITAETDEQVREIAAIVDLQWVRLLTHVQAPAAPSLDEALSYRYSPEEEAIRLTTRKRHYMGAPSEVHRMLAERATAGGAEEIMMMMPIYDHARRVRAYELMAEAFGITPPTR